MRHDYWLSFNYYSYLKAHIKKSQTFFVVYKHKSCLVYPLYHNIVPFPIIHHYIRLQNSTPASKVKLVQNLPIIHLNGNKVTFTISSKENKSICCIGLEFQWHIWLDNWFPSRIFGTQNNIATTIKPEAIGDNRSQNVSEKNTGTLPLIFFQSILLFIPLFTGYSLSFFFFSFVVLETEFYGFYILQVITIKIWPKYFQQTYLVSYSVYLLVFEW